MGMRRGGLVVVALLALVAALLGPAGQASYGDATGGAAAAGGPRTTLVHVLRLPTGPHPHVDYLTGRLLHTASGRQILLPFPAQRADDLELLGRAPRGWLVIDHHTATIYQISTEGHAHRLFHYWEDQGYEGFAPVTVSTNHRLFAIGSGGQDESCCNVYDFHGKPIGGRNDVGTLRPMLFRGRSIYFYKHGTMLWRWSVGHDPVKTGLHAASYLDFAHDQYLHGYVTPGGNDGFEAGSISTPHHFRWRVCTTCDGQDVQPYQWSPDGTAITFLDDTSPGTGVIIRGARTGHVLSDLRFTERVWQVRWEDSRHVLVEVLRPEKGKGLHADPKAVLRCGLHGACVRATQWQQHFILDYLSPLAD
jgi:hypothetical protein